MNTIILKKKICLLGSFAVGKTSLVRRFVDNSFDEKYLSTVGVTISRKEVQVKQNTAVNMVIWDLAGADKFNGKHTSYLQGAAGAFLVCDLSRKETFSYIKKYQERIESISPNIKLIIIGNKVDLIASPQNAERELAQLADEINASYFLTSAKEGTNVEGGFHTLAEALVEMSK